MFEVVYLEQNRGVPEIEQWPENTVWKMSVVMLQLNTSLHNPSMQKLLKYDKQAFIDLCCKAELQFVFSISHLGEVFDNIRLTPFKQEVNIYEKHIKQINMMMHSLGDLKKHMQCQPQSEV